jgi:hypothetical protein
MGDHVNVQRDLYLGLEYILEVIDMKLKVTINYLCKNIFKSETCSRAFILKKTRREYLSATR